MGLIKAAVGSVKGVFADQWKEYFYCDSLEADVLAIKGQKKISGRFGNKKGSDNIISNGSTIAVNEGQCMIIVDQGKVVEFCAEPGEFVWNASSESSIFTGDLDDAIEKTFEAIGRRFTYGGETGKDQRVYYFNMKEIMGNRYGTATPIPFRVVDNNIGLDVDISIRCNGEYSYKIVDPILFYTNVCGNVEYSYDREEIDSMLKTELLTALQPAFAKISDMGIRYSSLPAHTLEIANVLNEILSDKWAEKRGIKIASIGINSVTASPEDEQMIKELQKTAVYRNASMAGATLVNAQAEAMKKAAENKNGSMTGFMGMGMAERAGGMNAQSFFEMSQNQSAAQNTSKEAEVQNKNAQESFKNEWKCSCGALNTGKFCCECGKPKPADDTWTCKCGAVNKGKFCSECGSPKPVKAAVYKCNKCGWQPEDPSNPPKFCPECGDPFNQDDIQ